MKFKLSPIDNLAQLLREEVSNVLGAVQGDLQSKIEDLAIEVKEKIAQIANDKLHRTAGQYKSALKILPLDNMSFAIVLDASAAHLEEGYEAFDMKPGLLQEGSSGPMPNSKGAKGGVRTSKDGYRYRAIPMDQKIAPANPEHPLHDSVVSKGKANQQTMGSLAADLKHTLKRTGLGGISKGSDGKPLMGKIGSVTPGKNPGEVNVSMTQGNSFSADMGKSLGGSTNELNPMLSGITKFQYAQKNRNGSTTVKAAYMTFRIVSNNPKYAGKWIHPGFAGVKAFDQVHVWAEHRFEQILNEIFQNAS